MERLADDDSACRASGGDERIAVGDFVPEIWDANNYALQPLAPWADFPLLPVDLPVTAYPRIRPHNQTMVEKCPENPKICLETRGYLTDSDPRLQRCYSTAF